MKKNLLIINSTLRSISLNCLKNWFAAITIFLLLFPNFTAAQTVITVGASGANYTTIETAYGTGIPTTITGAYIIELQSNYDPAGESYPITLAAKTGASETNTITIRPASGVSSAFNITANVTTQTFTFNGADYVIIDGRPGGSGTNKYITIENTSTNNSASTNTIQFINDAIYNVIKYCTIKGSVTNGAAGSGAISFSTATTTGNDNNTIQYCDLTGGSSGRPFAMIGALGSSTKENNGNIIEYNNFYDHFVAGATSNGIAIGQYNNDFIIRNNSFYETTTFQPSGAFTFTHVSIGGTTSSNGHIVSNNYFGGKSAECGGAAMEIDGGTTPVGAVYRAISVNAGSTTATSIQGNTIKNINLKSNSASCFGAIYVTGGNVNIGTETGNTIGSSTGNGSIYVTSYSTSSNTIYGIYFSGSGSLTISNNTVGSITAANNDAANETVSIVGIYSSATGTIGVSNNTVGSTSTSNSIWASSYPTGTDAQRVYGIWGAGTTPANMTISGNTISNLRNDYAGTTASCGTYGIGVQSTGNYTITNNTVSYLYSASAITGTTEGRGLIGIYSVATGNSGTSGQNITGNKINNLYSTHATAGVQPAGIYYKCQFGDTKDYSSDISNNFIHSIFISSTSTSAALMGIHLDNSGTFTYNISRNVYNNIISLGSGEDDNCYVYGIYESNSGNRKTNLYFNTVYIGGSPNGNVNTYALNISGSSASNVRDIRNNIFVNARSRTGGTGKHYAGYFGNSSGLTVNYNDYYAPGTGGTLGYYPSADKTTLPIVTSQDANSKNIDPQFINAGGTNASDYRVQNTNLKAGVAISGYSTDYGDFTRPDPPTIGAIEFDNPLPVELISFTGKAVKSAVNLRWVTATEVNNYGFEIQRMTAAGKGQTESLQWENLGFVAGSGNSNSEKSYSFTDRNINAGMKYFYRLKQIDSDGSFDYSDVIEVLTGLPDKYELSQNYPNPFNPSTVINWSLPEAGYVTLNVYNPLGEKVALLFAGEAEAGSYSVSFNAASLPSGVYIYQLKSENFSAAKRMLLQK